MKIGSAREDAMAITRAHAVLENKYPDVRVETGLDGQQYIPLQEIERLDRRVEDFCKKNLTEGEKSGYERGLAEGRATAQKAFDELARATKDALSQRETLLREAEADIIDLTLKLARKLVFDVARVDPDVTARVVKGAIDSMVDKREMTVKVHPDHLPHLEQLMDEFQSVSTEIRKLTLEPDPRVGYGGCFICTPSGDIDARLESQFEVIEEAVRGSD
ncbi:MAG: FliH/SctL family protein [Candidatus Zixiibacteriota bacterium]